MESKCFRPQTFETDVSARNSANKWRHWKKQLENYIRRLDQATAHDKLDILVSLSDTSVYSYISECQTFDLALARLDGAFVKSVNEVFARFCLNTCRQYVESPRKIF